MNVIDRIAEHLGKQAKMSMNPDSKVSSYKSDDGCMCGVGCLVPSELYRPEIESCSIFGLLDNHRDVYDALSNEISKEPIFDDHPITILQYLQHYHDRGAYTLLLTSDEFIQADESTRISLTKQHILDFFATCNIKVHGQINGQYHWLNPKWNVRSCF